MKEAVAERPVRFISLRLKLLVGFTVVFSVVFAVTYWWFYNFATDFALKQIRDDMVTTLNAGAAGIDGDAFAAMAVEAELREDGLTDDARYWEHMAWLGKIHTLEPRAYPYTWIRGDAAVENEVLFIGDILRVTDPDNATVLREPYITEGSMIEGLSGLWEDLEPYEDKWGHWISAYMPIRNAAGDAVGGMGVDFRADYVFEVQKAIRDRISVSFVIAYATLFLLVYLITGALTSQVMKLTTVATAVADGNYAQDIGALYRGWHHDEVDRLAQAFETMVGKVRTREESLRREVQQLRIEIDQTKKKRQVEEITESDYFHQLSQIAKDLRRQGE